MRNHFRFAIYGPSEGSKPLRAFKNMTWTHDRQISIACDVAENSNQLVTQLTQDQKENTLDCILVYIPADYSKIKCGEYAQKRIR